jgi:hypothetical protein
MEAQRFALFQARLLSPQNLLQWNSKFLKLCRRFEKRQGSLMRWDDKEVISVKRKSMSSAGSKIISCLASEDDAVYIAAISAIFGIDPDPLQS